MGTSREACTLRCSMLRESQRHASAFSCRCLKAIEIALLLAAGFGLAESAYAGTAVQVIETWPSGDDIALGRNQYFHLRLSYDTDEPVGIWVTPYFHGKRVSAGSSPSQTYTGSGETFSRFFFMQPGDDADEIRVKAGDGGLDGTPVVAVWHGHRVGSSVTPAAQAQPIWVTEMSARAKAAQDRVR